MVPGRDLARLLSAREPERLRGAKEGAGPMVLVEDVDQEAAYEDVIDEVYGSEASGEETERGRSMVRIDSRERST